MHSATCVVDLAINVARVRRIWPVGACCELPSSIIRIFDVLRGNLYSYTTLKNFYTRDCQEEPRRTVATISAELRAWTWTSGRCVRRLSALRFLDTCIALSIAKTTRQRRHAVPDMPRPRVEGAPAVLLERLLTWLSPGRQASVRDRLSISLAHLQHFP